MKQLEVFYPGWVRKAITFSIDDGNIPMDTKFLSIVQPAGLRGTFNLCTPLTRLPSAEAYRSFYRGYEIANHCHFHPHALSPQYPMLPVSDDPFDPQNADPAFFYRTAEPGVYRHWTRVGWRYIADNENYLRCVEKCQELLEEVFGKGAIRGFVWPFGEQNNPEVFSRLKALGFASIRKTGDGGFDLPADRNAWSYNATHEDLEEKSASYEALPEDGKLKWLCIGVHSIDYENAGKWQVLQNFCDRFGNRPEDFWYATVCDIFDYANAARRIEVVGDTIRNPSGTDLFLLVDGVRKTLRANSALTF